VSKTSIHKKVEEVFKIDIVLEESAVDHDLNKSRHYIKQIEPYRQTDMNLVAEGQHLSQMNESDAAMIVSRILELIAYDYRVQLNIDVLTVSWDLIRMYPKYTAMDFIQIYFKVKDGHYAKDTYVISSRGITREFILHWIREYHKERTQYIRLHQSKKAEQENTASVSPRVSVKMYNDYHGYDPIVAIFDITRCSTHKYFGGASSSRIIDPLRIKDFIEENIGVEKFFKVMKSKVSEEFYNSMTPENCVNKLIIVSKYASNEEWHKTVREKTKSIQSGTLAISYDDNGVVLTFDGTVLKKINNFFLEIGLPDYINTLKPQYEARIKEKNSAVID